MKPAIINIFSERALLVALLVVALVLRLILVLAAGDVVHHDGAEYFMLSGIIYKHLAAMDLAGVFRTPISGHWGALLFGAIPFSVQVDFLTREQASGIFFVLPQVVNIYLLYRIAVAIGFGSRTGLIAACLYAFSFSTIYQSRHVLPHDLSLMFFLLSLLVIAKTTQNSRQSVFFAGILAFLAMFTYYGYWTASGVALLFATGFRATSFFMMVTNGLIALAGFLLPAILFYGCGRWFGVDLVDQFLHFSHSIQFGEFHEGYSLPLAFFYDTEGALLFVWLAGVVAALVRPRDYSVQCLLFGIVMMYLMLVVTSNLMEYFVVYGRTARQLAPLFCLIAACALATFCARWLIPLLGIIVLGFAVNYMALYQVIFDRSYAEIRARILTTDSTPDREIREVSICRPQNSTNEICNPDPVGCELLFSWQPYQNLRFFQYDGMLKQQREGIRDFKVYLQLLDCPRETPGRAQ